MQRKGYEEPCKSRQTEGADMGLTAGGLGGGREFLHHFQSLSKNKMSNFAFKMEPFSTSTMYAGLSLCLPMNSYKGF